MDTFLSSPPAAARAELAALRDALGDSGLRAWTATSWSARGTSEASAKSGLGLDSHRLSRQAGLAAGNAWPVHLTDGASSGRVCPPSSWFPIVAKTALTDPANENQGWARSQ